MEKGAGQQTDTTTHSDVSLTLGQTHQNAICYIFKHSYEIKNKCVTKKYNFQAPILSYCHKHKQTNTHLHLHHVTQSDLQKLEFHNERLQLTTTTRLTIIHTAVHTPDFLHSHTSSEACWEKWAVNEEQAVSDKT